MDGRGRKSGSGDPFDDISIPARATELRFDGCAYDIRLSLAAIRRASREVGAPADHEPPSAPCVRRRTRTPYSFRLGAKCHAAVRCDGPPATYTSGGPLAQHGVVDRDALTRLCVAKLWGVSFYETARYLDRSAPGVVPLLPPAWPTPQSDALGPFDVDSVHEQALTDWTPQQRYGQRH
jgi:hypothetical protein